MTKIISEVASRFTGVRLRALIFSAVVLGAIVFPSPVIYAAPALSSVIDVSPYLPNGMVVAPNGETLYVAATYILNGGLTGFVDEVRVKTFDILRRNIANSELDSPNPLAMAITEDNSTLYIGNGTS
jgi:hypothetical protein